MERERFSESDLSCILEVVTERGLSRFQEAKRLVPVGDNSNGKTHLLTPETAKSWSSLLTAAAEDGENLTIVSAFRSIERQTNIICRKLKAGQTIFDILKVIAPPGYSEHHTGRAVDISTPGTKPLEIEFEQSSAFRWLCDNAGKYGFSLSYPRGNQHGFDYEPWHWCYTLK